MTQRQLRELVKASNPVSTPGRLLPQDQDVRTLFRSLRDEETEHVELVQQAIAKLPAHAAMELEDQDA